MRVRPAADAAASLRVLALAGTALVALTIAVAGQAGAQDSGDPLAAANPDNPILNRSARSTFGLDAGRGGLPALRGSGRAGARSTAVGSVPSTTGESTEGDSTVGLSGGGEGLSRLPRFRTGGGQSISALSGTTAQASTSLLRRRAAPPRRIGFATRTITRQPTQSITQDLRLSPVIQTPVSGVPLPSTVPLPRPLPALGLVNPPGLLLGAAFARGPNEPDPAYAPLGIKLGTFTFLPAFTQYVGYDSNPAQTVARLARGSAVLRSEGELAFRSDWSSSEFAGELRGGYSAFPNDEESNRPDASGATRLRIDLTRDTRIDIDTRLLIDTQRFGNPELGVTSATSRPFFATYGVTAGIAKNFNRFQVSLRGSVDRQVFQDARLSDGSTLIQSDRDANQYGVRLRAGYEISPVLTPFVETFVDTRVYDSPVDQAGLRRDSDGIAFTGGASFQLSRVISGEFSAGVQRREYVDPSLRSILAPVVNTALIWSMSPLTTVRFSQQTGVIETGLPGSSGAFTDVATLEVQHELLRNLSITVGGSYLSTNYEGVAIRERGFSALARADYRFNRWLTLRGSYIYQQLTSTVPDANYSGNVFLLGLRYNP